MSATWAAVLLGSAVVLALKVVGYVVPRRVVERPAVARSSALMTVALLASLVAVQTFAGGEDGDRLTVDARAAGIAVAAVAIWRRAPFLVVVLLAGATTAAVRWLAG